MAHTSVKPPITRAVHESLCDSLCHTHFLEANMAACKRAAALFTFAVASNLSFLESAFSSMDVALSISLCASVMSMFSAFSKSFTSTDSWLESTVAKPPVTTSGFHLPSSLKRRTPVSNADIIGAWLAKMPSCPVALGKITSEQATLMPSPSGDSTLSFNRSPGAGTYSSTSSSSASARLATDGARCVVPLGPTKDCRKR
mmetsp:Transcript_25945/g.53905  ORF Transcript_25945/g.53905 Transcript_25945/m.53905 type:complete len:200 (-) Transcript_25945:127-726(-)